MYTFESAMPVNKIHIINGPNLNLLGKREPDIYGSVTFKDYLQSIRKDYDQIELEYFQSNIEGEIIDEIQRIGKNASPILLNAGGYTHTSVAIADAVAAVESPVLEIHISQPAAREEERHSSLLAKYCKGSITGLGLSSYQLGIEFFINHYDKH